MNIILVMIPLSLLFLIAAAVIFFWATNHGQFDDLQSPGLMPMSDNLPDEDNTEDDTKPPEDADGA
jgi:cbb3-type cytochrome oxidase maturation protein